MSRIRRQSVVAVALAVLGVAATPAAAGTNPEQADGPGILTVEQTNMCMWGSDTNGRSCFGNRVEPAPSSPLHEGGDRFAGWRHAERAVAARKRGALVTQFARHDPDVVTVNEGCLDDLRAVAHAVHYELRYQPTGIDGHGKRPRQCSVGRGGGVNAILARRVTGPGPSGYFAERGHLTPTRTFLCAQVSTHEWHSVRICTAHLATGGRPSSRAYECAQLRTLLSTSHGPVVFAGDVNMSGSGRNCAPAGYYGLKDRENSAAGRRRFRANGVQQIYYTAGVFHRQSCGWAYRVGPTDHTGFLLELGASLAKRELGPCHRKIR